MTWPECCEKLKATLIKDGPAEVKEKFKSYDWNYPGIVETRRQIKDQLTPRLCWIFDDLNEYNVSSIFERPEWNELNNDSCSYDISEEEFDLYCTLLRLLPRLIVVKGREKAYEASNQLPYGYWEILDKDDRRKLLKAIQNVLPNITIARKYFPSADKENIDQKFSLLKNKLLHPEYHRTYRSLLKLAEIFSQTDEELISQLESYDLFTFEQSLNKLLRKYSKSTNGLIKSYPANKKELAQEMLDIPGLEVTEEDFISQIDNVLSE